MKGIYFSPEPCRVRAEGASKRAMLDAGRFSCELGFSQAVAGGRGSPLYALRIFRARARAPAFLAMYPYLCPPTRAAHRLRGLTLAALKAGGRLARRSMAVLYVVDLPLEQAALAGRIRETPDEDALRFERKLFDQFDVLCVFNERMERAIRERHGGEGRRFVRFGILDYGSVTVPPVDKSLGRERVVVHAGASSDERSLGGWPRELPRNENVRWRFFGRDGTWLSELSRPDISYGGFVPSEQLERTMADECHFGIIGRNPDTGWSEYHDFGSTSKFSAYITCGVPVLVPNQYRYISELVSEHGVGWTFDSFDEVPSIVSSVSPKRYRAARDNTLRLGEMLRNGYFFKQAVQEALRSGT